jgi:L-fucose isomerase-like protein
VKVALLSPYWDFFESSVKGDLRAAGRELAARVAATLEGVRPLLARRPAGSSTQFTLRGSDPIDAARIDGAAELVVVADEVADSRAAGAAAAERIAAAGPDALVVLQSIAVPPAFTRAALDALPDLPLVVFAAQRARRPPEPYSHADVAFDGATVGGPQLTNVLGRRGRPYALVAGTLEAAGDRLRAAVRAAAAAGRLRRARIARVGRPIDGYDCVDVDERDLRAATGIELVPVAPAVVGAAYAEADGAAVEAEVRAGWEIEAPCVARSTRFAAALQTLDERLGVAAGAMNCHVPEIRLGDEPGIAPCFALGRETSRGVPWTCAGDVVTAVAMLTVKLLGGAALYHEVQALDHGSDEALLANSGEHDLAFADPRERPLLRSNPWWEGACAQFSPAPGPGTLVAFTPHADEPSGFRYIVAEGEFTARRSPATGTVNAAFRFGGDEPVAASWERWARAGVNHHSAATPGHLGEAVAAVALHLGVGVVST